MKIPFNIPPQSKNEERYIREAIQNRKLSGDGPFNQRCSRWFVDNLNCPMAVITPSCTSALEMAMVLIDLKPGDEVILPSFTFTSTANVVALYGGIPVFIDVDPATLNLSVDLIAPAITKRTKCIVPVHYAGIGCDMEKIMQIAERHDLWVVEDAAQAIFAAHQSRHLGTWGHLAAFSFHESKNIVCGEGGALLVNDPSLIPMAEIVRDKGTNRQQFMNGQVDKYTWQEKGSSYLLSELCAAFLLSQLEEGRLITNRRLQVWNRYHDSFADLESKGFLRRMQIPKTSVPNAHLYYIILDSADQVKALLKNLKEKQVMATTHYVPLHSAPAGLKYGRVYGSMQVTNHLSARLLRMPMYADLNQADQDFVIQTVHEFFKGGT